MSYEREKKRINKVIKVRCKETPGDQYFGALFGCLGGPEETVKLWLNEKPGSPGEVANIKLQWVEWHSRNSAKVIAQRWLETLSNLYAPSHKNELSKIYFSRIAEKIIIDKFKITYTWTTGPRADEHILRFEEK